MLKHINALIGLSEYTFSMANTLVKKMTFSAMCLALGLILPFFTGQIPEIGNMLLPMHIPVFLAGFIVGPLWGAIVGAITPLLRSAIFGMPPLYPTAISMDFELFTYGLISGLLYRIIKRQSVFSVLLSLIGAMIAGRLVWGIAQSLLLLANGSTLTLAVFWTSAVINAIPGIILQIILFPLLLLVLDKARIVPFKKEAPSYKARKIINAIKDKEGPIVITIEGQSGAGKTILAKELAQHLDARIIRMDDFFLQNYQRTEERLNEVGGNIDYERFYEEIIKPLENYQLSTYRPFDCSTGSLKEEISLDNRRITVIEGVYSLHPYFGHYYDFAVFLSLPSFIQAHRIKKRDGKSKYLRYKQEWIPKENAYFDKFSVKEKADIHFKI